VPADLRLLTANGLTCDEAVLTGESVPVEKSVAAAPAGATVDALTGCALMGTVVSTGTADGVVVATGGGAEFGRIAPGLGEREPETDLQAGLRRFSVLLVHVALALTGLILVTNVLLHKPLIESLLFSLAIAVGITPQLLPAVVSTSLAVGTRRLARRKVLVKRLVCIEDLGDMDVLVTDKTGTLTEGRVTLAASMGPDGAAAEAPLLLGLLATEVDPAAAGSAEAAGNPLDRALWEAPEARRDQAVCFRRQGLLPFDHERRMTSTLVRFPDGALMMATKGAPEAVVDRCRAVPPEARATMREQLGAGLRLVAVASRVVDAAAGWGLADERDMQLAGFLAFLDPPKRIATSCLRRLASLGVTVQVATGDNPLVRAPSHWDIDFIRRFMVFFGPLSSVFDFLTFGVLLGVFHAGPELFRTAGSSSRWQR